MSFSHHHISLLSADLNRSNVRQRSQAGRSLSYIESWHAIAEANRIFGFDGWSSETVDIRSVSERERKIGPRQLPGWGVTYVARVRVSVYAGERGWIAREGVGSGHGIDQDLGQAHESAIKEAESDARKRALMTFGNQFGLALYDKEQRHVSDGNEPVDEIPHTQPKEHAPQASKPVEQPSTTENAPSKAAASVPAASSAPIKPPSRVDAIPTVKPSDPKADALARKAATAAADAQRKQNYSTEVRGNLLHNLSGIKADAKGARAECKSWLGMAKAAKCNLTDEDYAYVVGEGFKKEADIRTAESKAAKAPANPGAYRPGEDDPLPSDSEALEAAE